MKNVRNQRVALTLFLFVFAVYIFPLAYDLLHKPFFNWVPGQDLVSTSLLPVEILKRGDFFLDDFQGYIAKTFHDPYFVASINGRIVSRSPVAAAIIALPFYGVPLATGWLAQSGRDWLVYPETALFIAKFSAVTLCALAALFFFFCARELANVKTSVALTLVFAFGTSLWSTNSQGLWQQTPSVLLQLIGLWFLLRGHRAGARAAAPGAVFFSMATAARANNAIPALLFTMYVWSEFRESFWRWILWALPPAFLFLAYNTIYNGSPLVFGYQDGVAQYLRMPQLAALLGLLFSPSRGLLAYSPFFILLPIGLMLSRKEKDRLFYLYAASTLVFGIMILCSWEYWDGGWGYGTRMFTDLLPYAMLLLIPVCKVMSSRGRMLLWLAVGYAVLVHSFALWDYGTRWHWHWPNYNYDVWDWGESEPLYYFKEYLSMARHYLVR